MPLLVEAWYNSGMVYIQRWSNNKYRNVKQEYNGVRYDSKKEAYKAYELDLLLKAGEIKGWDRQVRLSFNIMYERGRPVLTGERAKDLKEKGKVFWHLWDYLIDFVIYHNNGSIEYLEIKGLETPEWKKKWKLTEALYNDHPTIFLTVEK